MFCKLVLAIITLVVPAYTIPLPPPAQAAANSITLVAWAPDLANITAGAEYTVIGTTLGGIAVEGLATYTYTDTGSVPVASATVTEDVFLSPTEIAVIAVAPIFSLENGVAVNEGTAVHLLDCAIQGNNGICEYIESTPDSGAVNTYYTDLTLAGGSASYVVALPTARP